MAYWQASKGAWRIVADLPREGDKRRRIMRYVHAPHDAGGERRAIAAEVALRDDVAAGRVGGTAGSFETYARAWQRRARSKRGPWSPGTRRTVAEALDAHILPALGHRPADQITGADIEGLYAQWSEYLAPSNIRRKHAMIRKVYADMERLGEIAPDRNPMRRVEPGGGNAPARMHMPTPADVHRLADEAGKHSLHAALWVYVAAYTGARRGSVLALRWRNIDLEAGRIYVERAFTLGDDGQLHEKSNKGGDPYGVEVRGRVVELLREARARAAETALALGDSARLGDLFVFSSDGGATPWSVAHPSKVFRLAARRLGLSWPRDGEGDGGVTLHDLRHFAASQQLAAGIPPEVVARRMGCTVANVLRTYHHYIPSRENARAADVMAGVLG